MRKFKKISQKNAVISARKIAPGENSSFPKKLDEIKKPGVIIDIPFKRDLHVKSNENYLEKPQTLNEYYAEMNKIPQINPVNISKYIRYSTISTVYL